MLKKQHTESQVFYIVTPTYNSELFIEQTIFSIITQAGDFFIQYHIQDGGSTDSTLTILKNFESIIYNGESTFIKCKGVYFSYASEADCGMYDAINKGFSSLSVPDDGIMCWLNSDDTFMPHALATVAKAFRDVSHVQWLSSRVNLVTPDGALIQAPREHIFDYYPQALLASYCCDGVRWPHVQQSGVFWLGRLWHQGGELDAQWRFAGDFELWGRFARHAPMIHYPVHTATFRVRAGQLSTQKGYADESLRISSSVKRTKAFLLFLGRNIWLPKVPWLQPDYTSMHLMGGRYAPRCRISFLYAARGLVRSFLYPTVKFFQRFFAWR